MTRAEPAHSSMMKGSLAEKQLDDGPSCSGLLENCSFRLSGVGSITVGAFGKGDSLPPSNARSVQENLRLRDTSWLVSQCFL